MVVTHAPLQAQGSLLDDWLDEPDAAAEIGLKPLTLTAYRKAGKGPKFSIVARRIKYHRANLRTWLEEGGTRQADEALKGSSHRFPYSPPGEIKNKPKAPLKRTTRAPEAVRG